MSMEQALREAYASANVEDVVLHTLELLHASFVDDNGQPTSIRVVRDFKNRMFTLEASAPMNPNQSVLFVGCPFEFSLPGYEESGTPELSITISNVSRQITTHLEQAITDLRPIQLIYRPYLESDATAPQMDPVISMQLTKVSVNSFSATGKANLNDVHNWPFPARKYNTQDFPGLAR